EVALRSGSGVMVRNLRGDPRRGLGGRERAFSSIRASGYKSGVTRERAVEMKPFSARLSRGGRGGRGGAAYAPALTPASAAGAAAPASGWRCAQLVRRGSC